MKLLLDTHAALWWLGGDPRFGRAAAAQMEAAGNQLLLSAAVVWEIGIKRALGQLEAPSDIVDLFLDAGAAPLPIALEHAAAASELPLHHRDPFDRMLLAQALAERAVLVSADDVLRSYGVPMLW